MPWYVRFFKWLLKLLLEAALVALIYFIFMQVYFRKHVFDPQTTSTLAAQGVNLNTVGGLVAGLKYQAAMLQKKLDRQQENMDHLLEHGTPADEKPDRYIYAVR